MEAVRSIAMGAIALASVVLSAQTASAADPPAKPTNLRVVQVSDTSMTLAWDQSQDDGRVVNYEVYFDDNPTPILTSQHQWTQKLNRTIGMVPGSSHTFRVRTEDMSGNASEFSETLTARFAGGDTTPPTTPRNLRVASNTAKGVELAWDASDDQSAITYRVLGRGISWETREPRILIAANDPVAGTTPGSTHSFRVSAGDPYQNVSPISAPITVRFID